MTEQITFESLCEERGATVKGWTNAKKGDVLIWHAWLAHRGSTPSMPGMLRKSLIAHYSGVNHRPDMQEPVWWVKGESKGRYFPF